MFDSYKLDNNEIEKLKSYDVLIEKMQGDIEKLKKVGVDTSDLQAKLTLAKTIKDNLLIEFSNN